MDIMIMAVIIHIWIEYIHCTGIVQEWLSTFSGPVFSSLWPPSEPLRVKVSWCPVFSQHASLDCWTWRSKSAQGNEASGFSIKCKTWFSVTWKLYTNAVYVYWFKSIITINYKVQSFTSEVYVQLFTCSWKSKQVTQFHIMNS